jgi:DUF4097 and DUF4098 domain-containing protein YvlB
MAQLMSTLWATSITPVGATPVRSPQVRKLWKVVGFLLAVILLAGILESIVGSVAYTKIPSTHRIFAGSISTLNVNIDSGSVTIERSDRSSTVVDSSGYRGLVSPTNSEYVRNKVLFVRSTCHGFFDNYCNRHFTIHVPSTVDMTVDTGQGDIAVSGVKGAVTLTTGQGDVDIAGNPLSLRVTTGQGSITTSALSSGSVFAHTGQGNVFLNFSQPPTTVTALTGQGDISVSLPRGHDSYRLDAVTNQGNAVKDVRENSASHRIIQASSGQGNIVIRYNKNAPHN